MIGGEFIPTMTGASRYCRLSAADAYSAGLGSSPSASTDLSNNLDKLDVGRQKRLFYSAAEEFAAHGFDGASLDRILEKSGMSKSSLYYYFDDKADLFTTMIERSLAVLFEEISGFDPKALDAETFWPTFEALYRRAIAVVDKNAWLVPFGGMFYRCAAIRDRDRRRVGSSQRQEGG